MVHLLKRPGRLPTVLATRDLPCGACEAPLRYDELRRRWRCPTCGRPYDREALAKLVARYAIEAGMRRALERLRRELPLVRRRRGASE